MRKPYHPSQPSSEPGLEYWYADRRTLADFRGKVVTLFFGYTHCPDVCPTTLADIAQAVRSLGADAERVQGLLIEDGRFSRVDARGQVTPF